MMSRNLSRVGDGLVRLICIQPGIHDRVVGFAAVESPSFRNLAGSAQVSPPYGAHQNPVVSLVSIVESRHRPCGFLVRNFRTHGQFRRKLHGHLKC